MVLGFLLVSVVILIPFLIWLSLTYVKYDGNDVNLTRKTSYIRFLLIIFFTIFLLSYFVQKDEMYKLIILFAVIVLFSIYMLFVIIRDKKKNV